MAKLSLNKTKVDEYAFYFLIFVALAFVFDGIKTAYGLSFIQTIFLFIPTGFVIGFYARRYLKIR